MARVKGAAKVPALRREEDTLGGGVTTKNNTNKHSKNINKYL